MKRFFLIVLLVAALFLTSNQSRTNAAVAVLTLGSQGQNVVVLQQKLAEDGFYQGSTDGVFGSATRGAVMAFQAACGLVADGVAGPATIEQLRYYRGQTLTSRSAGERRGQQVVDLAMRFMGVPYVWAGSSPTGFDCSGFIAYVFRLQNVNMPRMADEQYAVGSQVAVSQLQPGDLLFFSTYEPGPSHVGIYVGGGNFIHASSGAGRVTITSLASSYYQARYLGAKRIF